MSVCLDIHFKHVLIFAVTLALWLFIIWDGKLKNSSPHWGAVSPFRGKVIKMLCAQLKHAWISGGPPRKEMLCTKDFWMSDLKCLFFFFTLKEELGSYCTTYYIQRDCLTQSV